jgi:hypothetical protein
MQSIEKNGALSPWVQFYVSALGTSHLQFLLDKFQQHLLQEIP